MSGEFRVEVRNSSRGERTRTEMSDAVQTVHFVRGRKPIQAHGQSAGRLARARASAIRHLALVDEERPFAELDRDLAGDRLADALRCYRDALGLRQKAVFSSPGGRVTLLGVGRAMIEPTDPPDAAHVDEVEVGRRVAGHIRVAFEVGDVLVATARLAAAGSTGGGWGTRDHGTGRDAVAVAELAAGGADRVAADAVRGAGAGVTWEGGGPAASCGRPGR